MTAENSTYRIPEQNIPKFEKKLAQLSKKAEKLLGYPITYVYFGEDVEVKDNGLVVKYYDVVVNSEHISLMGWEFLGVIDHMSADAGNIVRLLPNKVIPLEYRTRARACTCDHCKVNRFRRDTYIVRNLDSGEIQQVGSSCLKDFLGHANPENIAKMAELMSFLNEFAHGCEQYFDYQGGMNTYDLETYLQHVFATIKQYGWTSKKTAMEKGEDSTSALAFRRMHDSETFRALSEGNEQDAEAAISWAAELTDAVVSSNDYLYNIRTIAKSATVDMRTLGFAASIAAAYLRDKLSKEEKAQKVSTSDWIGAVGDKVTLGLTITNIRPIDGSMGVITLYSFLDDNGNEVRWFASSNQNWNEGDKLMIRGTVKKLDEYKGIRQTILTRCKVQ